MRRAFRSRHGELGIGVLANGTKSALKAGPETKGGAGRANEARTRALVVGPYLDAGARRKAELLASTKAARGRPPEARLSEALGLAQAIGVEIVAGQIAPLSQIRPASYLGKGKVAELAALVSAEKIDK